MKIALLALGTRDDVQPFAVLGNALQKRGYEVVLGSAKKFGHLANDYGLEFRAIDGDFYSILNSEEGRAALKNTFLSVNRFPNIVKRMMVKAMHTFYDLARESDRILFNVYSLADSFADQFPHKMIRANTIPAFEPTDEFPNPLYSGLYVPKILNRFTYKIPGSGFSVRSKAVREFRATSGLNTNATPMHSIQSVYGISSHFLSKPKDYSSESLFTGFWHAQSDQRLDTDVVDFLSMGCWNLLVSLEDLPGAAQFDLQKSIINLTRGLSINVVVMKGRGFPDLSALANIQSVKVIEQAPLDKLVPRVNAVVHNGSIGIITECLSAGVPFLSCPSGQSMAAQSFWAKQAYSLGCSPEPVPLRDLHDVTLNQGVAKMLTSLALHSRSTALGNLISSENGVESAADVIEKQFHSRSVRSIAV